MSQDKEKALKITTDQIEQKFGKGSIMKLGESTNLQVGVIPTGALPLDVALGIELLKSMALSQAVKLLLHFILLLKLKLQEGL